MRPLTHMHNYINPWSQNDLSLLPTQCFHGSAFRITTNNTKTVNAYNRVSFNDSHIKVASHRGHIQTLLVLVFLLPTDRR